MVVGLSYFSFHSKKRTLENDAAGFREYTVLVGQMCFFPHTYLLKLSKLIPQISTLLYLSLSSVGFSQSNGRNHTGTKNPHDGIFFLDLYCERQCRGIGILGIVSPIATEASSSTS